MTKLRLSDRHIEIIKEFLKIVHRDDLSRAHVELEHALHDLGVLHKQVAELEEEKAKAEMLYEKVTKLTLRLLASSSELLDLLEE